MRSHVHQILRLRRYAARLGVQVFALSIGERIANLREHVEDLLNEAEGLTEADDLTPDQQRRWNALMAEDTGLIAQKKAELLAAEQKAADIKRLAAERSEHVRTRDFRNQFDGTSIDDHSSPRGNIQVVPRKLNAFKSEQDAYRCGLWLKGVVLGDRAAREKLGNIYATQTEGTDSAGGFLVPEPLAQAIIFYREQVGVSRQLAQIYPMTSDTLAVPKQTGGTQIYYPGEATAITESEVTVGRINFTAVKRAALTFISTELADDAIIPMADFIASDFGHQLALKEDQEMISGDGTATYGGETGLLSAIGTAGVHTAPTGTDTWEEIAMTDIAAMASKLPDKHRVLPQLSWLCSAPFKWSVLDRLAVGANGALASEVVNGVQENRFLGYPIRLSDRMPTSSAAGQVCLLFGNFTHGVAIGERSGVRVDTSPHVRFTSDEIGVRATVRYDINVHEAGDASNAGAYVALKTSAT